MDIAEREKRNLELQKEKKRQLQQRFLEQMKNQVKTSSIIETQEPKPKANRVKKERAKKIKKPVLSFRDEKEIKSVRKKNFEQAQLIKRLEEENRVLLEKVKYFDSKEKELTKGIERLQKENQISKRIKPTKKDNNKAKLEKYEKQILDLKKQLKIAETFKRAEQVRAIPQVTPKKKTEVIDLDLATLVHLLNEKISLLDNDKQNKHLTKLLTYIEDYRYRVGIKQRTAKAEAAPKPMKDFSDIRLGHVVRRDSEWYFYDLQNNIFPLRKYPVHLQMDDPVKVIIVDEKADVVWVYKAKHSIQTIKRAAGDKRKRNGKQEGIVIKYPGIKVLAIGIERKNQIIDCLKKHGVEVVWHDPTNESEEQLRAKFERANIVFFFALHNKHAVHSVIDLNNQKVEKLFRDTDEVLSARLRFAALRLGLIQ